MIIKKSFQFGLSKTLSVSKENSSLFLIDGKKLYYRFIGTSLEESCVYIFMEYIAGGSIAGLIAK